MRSSPRKVTHSSLPLRVNVGSWGSRPTRMPLERRSALVWPEAKGFGTLPMTRFCTASIRYTLLEPRPLVASIRPSGEGTAPCASMQPW